MTDESNEKIAPVEVKIVPEEKEKEFEFEYEDIHATKEDMEWDE